MEGLSISVYKGLKQYWRRRGYDRVNGTNRRRKNRVELGRAGGSNRRRRFWRIKITPKLLRFSPKKFLLGLRDAYVNFMLRIANSGRVISNGFGVDSSFGKGPLKEYDEKMLVEIYKSLMVAQSQLVSRDATRFNTQIVCRQ